MKRITTLLLIFSFVATYAQDKEEFKPSGQPFAKIFFNYHTDFDQTSAFEIQRGYFGYKYKMSKEFAADITLDVGSADVSVMDTSGAAYKSKTSLEMTAFLKTAGITYTKGSLKIQLGLIGLQQFKLQESNWGHRYIYKAYQDAAGMGHSADMGMVATYKFGDMLSADLTIRNGEGYKKLTVDNKFLYGAGITLSPFDGLVIRGYYDVMNKNDVNQVTLAHFVGYKVKGLTVGAEYNIQKNNKNVSDQNLSGFSVSASYDVNDKLQVFGRFDQYASNTLAATSDPWNIDHDGNYLIAGLQYSPIKNILFALNYRGKMPALDGESMEHAAYLNCQFAF